MKARPILFSAPMVRALLAGTKTQTRRGVKPQPPADTFQVTPYHHPDNHPRFFAWKDGFGGAEMHPAWEPIPCPYGQPSDQLWVRESWKHIEGGNVYDAAGGVMDSFEHETLYRASSPNDPGPWKPSIHMPRWASRITLEITGVRVERLQDITPDDCIAEGAWPIEMRELGRGHEAIAAFRTLWESIDGNGSWAENPWVWVLEFRRLQEGGAA